MDAVAIRPFAAGDEAAVAALITELGYPSDAADMAGRMATIAARRDFATLVAVDGGRIVGVIGAQVSPSYEHNVPAGRIVALIIGEGERGSGVGRRLVAAAEAWMIAAGADRVAVTSHVRRKDAHAFYLRLGYAQTGLRFAKVFATGG